MTTRAFLAVALTAAGWSHAGDSAPEVKKAERVGWVSDGHCGAEHMTSLERLLAGR